MCTCIFFSKQIEESLEAIKRYVCEMLKEKSGFQKKKISFPHFQEMNFLLQKNLSNKE